MEREKTLILDVKNNITDFVSLIEPDRSKNTLNVINKYIKALEDLGKIDAVSTVAEDVQFLRGIMSGIEEVVSKDQSSTLTLKLKTVILNQFEDARNQLSRFGDGFNLDGRLDELITVFMQGFETPGKSRKEIFKQRDNILDILAENSSLTRSFLTRLMRDIKTFFPKVAVNEDFSRVFFISTVLESLITIQDLKAREDVALLEKYVARLVILSLKDMSEKMDYLLVIKNAKMILKQLPIRVKKIVMAALPAKWASSLALEEPLVFTPAMNDKLFGSNMPGLVIKKVAVGEGTQSEIIRLLESVKEQGLSRRDLAQLLAAKSRPIADEVLTLLSEEDRTAVLGLLGNPDTSVQIIRKKLS